MNKSSLIRSILLGFTLGIALYGVTAPKSINADLNNTSVNLSPATLIHNGHLTICKIDKNSYEIVKTVKMVITAYTNIPELTDDSPNITASNKQVEYGMVATNMFKFGTKVQIPEIYGDEVFVVEDRMNSRYKNKPYLDVFLPTYKEAKNFGFEITNVHVLEN